MAKKNGYVIDNVIDKLQHCKQLLGNMEWLLA